ncbi:MAG: polysaccharide deacetylase family protein [Oscillospiraceae bacterium]
MSVLKQFLQKTTCAALCALTAAVAASCSAKEPNTSDDNSANHSVTTAAVRPVANLVHNDAALADVNSYAQIDNTKRGFGQGRQLDKENRPAGAIDFNQCFGKYDALAIHPAEQKTITLTFDQGYENGYTTKILDTLKEKNVHAIFFVLQDYAEKNPELVSRMIAEGHIVGNHSVTHRSMPGLSVQNCISEVMNLHTYMLENFNYEMHLFRPPMGEFSERSLAVTKDCGYKTMMWSYAYADWDVNKQPDPDTALKNLVKFAHNGEILLLHSVSKTNTAILPAFIDQMLAQGYTFTTE